MPLSRKKNERAGSYPQHHTERIEAWLVSPATHSMLHIHLYHFDRCMRLSPLDFKSHITRACGSRVVLLR
jgi:hypothetical protein